MKKILLSLCLVWLWIINFSSSYTITVDNIVTLTSSNNRTATVDSWFCVYLNFSSRVFNIVDWNNSLTLTNPINTIYCFEDWWTISTTSTTSTSINIFDFTDYISSISSCDYSSYESQIESLSWDLATCQWMYDRLDSDYDLLEWNYNTCVSSLSSCLENWWVSWSWDVQWSSLYINNLQYLWNKNIYLTIPEYIDYSYVN